MLASHVKILDLLKPVFTLMHLPSCVGVVISFIDVPYEVNETDGVARVTVGVVSGQLMREVVVAVSFSDETAISKQYCLM